MGTSVGTSVFNAHGWRAAAALSLGWQGFCLIILLLRGPHVPRYTWFGYKGGLELRKRVPPPPQQSPAQADSEKAPAAVDEKRSAGEDVGVIEEKRRGSVESGKEKDSGTIQERGVTVDESAVRETGQPSADGDRMV